MLGRKAECGQESFRYTSNVRPSPTCWRICYPQVESMAQPLSALVAVRCKCQRPLPLLLSGGQRSCIFPLDAGAQQPFTKRNRRCVARVHWGCHLLSQKVMPTLEEPPARSLRAGTHLSCLRNQDTAVVPLSKKNVKWIRQTKTYGRIARAVLIGHATLCPCPSGTRKILQLPFQSMTKIPSKAILHITVGRRVNEMLQLPSMRTFAVQRTSLVCTRQSPRLDGAIDHEHRCLRRRPVPHSPRT